MNVPTITPSQEGPWQARQKYAEYLRAVKERHSAEYEALKNAYRELSRGRQVLDLVQVMRSAGVDHLHRPKLAIARADARLCWFEWSSGAGGRLPEFRIEQWAPNRNRKANRIRLPAGTFPNTPVEVRQRSTLRAVVPMIPPSLLPAGSLEKYHILWEAEWEQIPVDPMLLKHLGQHLYVVLATWDLTPLERAVLSDRI